MRVLVLFYILTLNTPLWDSSEFEKNIQSQIEIFKIEFEKRVGNTLDKFELIPVIKIDDFSVESKTSIDDIYNGKLSEIIIIKRRRVIGYSYKCEKGINVYFKHRKYGPVFFECLFDDIRYNVDMELFKIIKKLTKKDKTLTVVNQYSEVFLYNTKTQKVIKLN